MITRIEAYGIALLILGILVGIACFKAYRAGEEHVQEKWDAAVVAQREKEQQQANAAIQVKEKGDAKAQVVYRTITQQVDKLVDRPVYRNVCLDADGLQVANQALRGTLAPATEPNRSVPGSKPTGRGNVGGGVAETGGGVEPILRLSTETLRGG